MLSHISSDYLGFVLSIANVHCSPFWRTGSLDFPSKAAIARLGHTARPGLLRTRDCPPGVFAPPSWMRGNLQKRKFGDVPGVDRLFEFALR